MRRWRIWLSGAVVMLLGLNTGAFAQVAGVEPPVYEPRFLGVVNYGEGTCTAESEYDIDNTARYGNDCTRLKFVFGPILAKPGQNDVLIQPVTFEKPWNDGFMVRNKPNLVDQLGRTPPVEDLHLHHGTWLNANRNYGSGPFWASGEEKTVLIFPEKTGIRIMPSDQWLLLHMVHNASPQPMLTYITYEMDYVPLAAAERIGIKNLRQIWLDVGGGRFHPQAEPYLLNPVFNTQRGFGQPDRLGYESQVGFDGTTGDASAAGSKVCYYPRENCARFNSAGRVSAQQGLDVSDEVDGKDQTVDAGLGGAEEGTLVVMGGHLHPGGVRTEVELVRKIDGVEHKRLINISDAVYWDHAERANAGGPPISWDLSMTGTIRDLGWSVRVKKGDILRLNGVYETDIASWYEQMGIVMTWVLPGDTSGIDVFDPNTVLDHRFPGGNDAGVLPARLPPNMAAAEAGNLCTPGFNPETGKTTLCTRGQVTRPAEDARGNHNPGNEPALPTRKGPVLDEITVQGFSYGPADLGVIAAAGVPQVKAGKPLRFTNVDTAGYIWHTITRCKQPCTGATTASYPLADGGKPREAFSSDAEFLADPMDFDSSELGFGLAPAQRAEWTFTPTETGVYAFWCRIHPWMRGAFEVVP
ncbi:MAG TPA: hypothetical protein VM840_01510 [Actinomycetota bacterium]|nr:hypothetical protein [Actinomycetota bacterium]